MKKKPVILVVDDDPLSLTMLEDILTQEGWHRCRQVESLKPLLLLPSLSVRPRGCRT